ncbi:MAG: eukaryotic-like serine/threonine-protein kinase [Verrucomicrobiota bacterium]|jgi:serine/threonine protein kinase/Flp pilus assembly protein TadD
MKLSPPTDPPFSIPLEPEICQECHSGSRLSNGLCLNCLLQGALDDRAVPTGKEAFKEVLSGVRSREGDWSIGEHEILDEIARGGMGVIYRAREPHSDRIVALKCILAYQGDSDQAQSRFRREAEMAARLDHPNIVPIYHIGETADGSPFFTMKYAAKGSLSQSQDARSNPRHSVALIAKVAEAVQYAHEQGVLHRDLKPGNILLDNRGEPLVSDFGLARCTEIASHLTRSLTSFGTPGYIAPEQADGPAVQLTAAADIYSLGAILFELLTGRLPFQGENVLGVLKQSASKPAPKLRTLAPHLDRDLETICARCLEADPGARYPTAGSLAQDLHNWLEGSPIVARPVGVWLRSRRWVRHNRRLAALLAAFIVLGVGSAVWQIRSRKLQIAMQESVLASHSLAVLPFLDLDTAAPDEGLARRFTAELQDQLSSIAPVRVTNVRTLTGSTTDELQQIARLTKARTLLTGTKRQIGSGTRISIRLMDSSSGELLLTHSWEAHGNAELARRLDTSMVRSLYSIINRNDAINQSDANLDPGLRNNETRDSILAARELALHYALPDLDRAVELLQKAIRLEPNSVLAHLHLANVLTAKAHYSSDGASIVTAEAEARRAATLSPNSAEAHRALAAVLYQQGQFQQVLEELIATAEVQGTDDKLEVFIGMTLDTLGHTERALPWYERARRSTKRPGEADTMIGDAWTKLGADERAMLAYQRAMELQPGGPRARVSIAHLRLLQGDFEGARRENQRTRQSDEIGDGTRIAAQIEFFARNFKAAVDLYSELLAHESKGGGSFYGAVDYQGALGRSLQEQGRSVDARETLMRCLQTERSVVERERTNPEAHYRLAAVEASLDLKDSSLQHLQSAVQLGWLDYRSLQMDPRFDSLRSNSQFNGMISNLSMTVAEKRKRAESLSDPR